MENEKIFGMYFAKVYPMLLAKAERKGRTKNEVNEAACWLTGYSSDDIQSFLHSDLTYGDFFRQAPGLNPDRKLIRGTICGVRVENIEDPLMQEIRYLDKLVDELAKGKNFGDVVEAVLQEKNSGKTSMWKCPKCGREFKKNGQSHFCGEKPKTIDEYILGQDKDKQEDLQQIRQILHRALPEAEERISWSMPTYWKKHNILHFAASKKHIGLYPGPEAVKHFSEELQGYKTEKGTIRIPYGKIDAALIETIAKWCWQTGNHA